MAFFEPTPDPATAVLLRLSGLLMAHLPTSSLEALEANVRAALQSAYLLADVGPDRDVDLLLATTVERLVYRLKPKTERRRTEYQGRVRGRVLWPETSKARLGEDGDPTRFVCREIVRRYDTPENQLLRFVLERLAEAARLFPPSLRAGACLYPHTFGLAPASTAARLARIEARLNAFLRNPGLRAVSVPASVTRAHLLRARSIRVDEYATMARFYERYAAMTAPDSWLDEVARAGKRVLPLPANLVGDAETWLRLGVAVHHRPELHRVTLD
jgi:hypothetical protein